MEDFNINIESIEFWESHERNLGGVEIVWSSPKGFGTYQYALYKDEGKFKLLVDDEYMGEEFAKAVLRKALNENLSLYN